jgi:hypothetical protein
MGIKHISQITEVSSQYVHIVTSKGKVAQFCVGREI